MSAFIKFFSAGWGKPSSTIPFSSSGSLSDDDQSEMDINRTAQKLMTAAVEVARSSVSGATLAKRVEPISSSTDIVEYCTEDLTALYKSSQLPPSYGREKFVCFSIGALRAGLSLAIFGASGVGKSRLVYKLVETLSLNATTASMYGAQPSAEYRVLRVNMTHLFRLCNSQKHILNLFGGGTNPVFKLLQKLSDEASGKNYKVLLIIDEAHLFFEQCQEKDLEAFLLPLSEGRLQVCIVSAVRESLSRFLSRPGFQRRFCSIDLEPLSEEESLPILRTYCKDTILKPGAPLPEDAFFLKLMKCAHQKHLSQGRFLPESAELLLCQLVEFVRTLSPAGGLNIQTLEHYMNVQRQKSECADRAVEMLERSLLKRISPIQWSFEEAPVWKATLQAKKRVRLHGGSPAYLLGNVQFVLREGYCVEVFDIEQWLAKERYPSWRNSLEQFILNRLSEAQKQQRTLCLFFDCSQINRQPTPPIPSTPLREIPAPLLEATKALPSAFLGTPSDVRQAMSQLVQEVTAHVNRPAPKVAAAPPMDSGAMETALEHFQQFLILLEEMGIPVVLTGSLPGRLEQDTPVYSLPPLQMTHPVQVAWLTAYCASLCPSDASLSVDWIGHLVRLVRMRSLAAPTRDLLSQAEQVVSLVVSNGVDALLSSLEKVVGESQKIDLLLRKESRQPCISRVEGHPGIAVPDWCKSFLAPLLSCHHADGVLMLEEHNEIYKEWLRKVMACATSMPSLYLDVPSLKPFSPQERASLLTMRLESIPLAARPYLVFINDREFLKDSELLNILKEALGPLRLVCMDSSCKTPVLGLWDRLVSWVGDRIIQIAYTKITGAPYAESEQEKQDGEPLSLVEVLACQQAPFLSWDDVVVLTQTLPAYWTPFLKHAHRSFKGDTDTFIKHTQRLPIFAEKDLSPEHLASVCVKMFGGSKRGYLYAIDPQLTHVFYRIWRRLTQWLPLSR